MSNLLSRKKKKQLLKCVIYFMFQALMSFTVIFNWVHESNQMLGMIGHTREVPLHLFCVNNTQALK